MADHEGEKDKYGLYSVDREKLLGGILKVNTKVTLKLFEGEYAGTYPSRVEDVSPSRLCVAGPTYRGELVQVISGMNLQLSTTGGNGVYEFYAQAEKVVRQPLYQIFLDLESLHEAMHIQRRRFVRTSYRSKIRFEILEGKDEPSPEGQARRGIEAMSKNISGNGICLIHNERIPKRTRASMLLNLVESEPPIHIIGEVVRADDPPDGPQPDRFDVGIRFVEIRLKDQDRIVRYIFDKERKEIRSK